MLSSLKQTMYTPVLEGEYVISPTLLTWMHVFYMYMENSGELLSKKKQKILVQEPELML